MLEVNLMFFLGALFWLTVISGVVTTVAGIMKEEFSTAISGIIVLMICIMSVLV